jgi:hypothetical protein
MNKIIHIQNETTLYDILSATPIDKTIPYNQFIHDFHGQEFSKKIQHCAMVTKPVDRLVDDDDDEFSFDYTIDELFIFTDDGKKLKVTISDDDRNFHRGWLVMQVSDVINLISLDCDTAPELFTDITA